MLENDYFRKALVYIVNERGRGSQNTISIDTGLSDAYISQVIAGKRSPSLDVQIKIVSALGIDYLDFLTLGKKLTEAKLQNIPLAEVARQRVKQHPLTTNNQSAAYDMLLRALQDQIAVLGNMVKEMKDERAELITELKEEQKRCWDRINAIQSHTEKMDETLDKINLDVGRVKNRMLDAARTGDIHHLEKISDAG